MPLISLGLENDNSSNFLEFVKNIFSSFGINYSFNTIFISFIIIYFLKIIVVLIIEFMLIMQLIIFQQI